MISSKTTRLLLPLMWLSACNQAPAAPPAPAEASDTAAAPAEGGDRTQCEAYGAALCSELGAETTACESARQTTALMPPAACKAGLEGMAFTKTKLKEKSKTCTTLMDKLCGDLGEQTDSCKMVRTQTPKMPPAQCEEMMAHYDEVVADLQRHEAESRPLEGALRTAIEADSPAAFGPADAPVTVVEFSDFQCPYCSRAAGAVDGLKKKFDGKVRVIFRHFPLSFHGDAKLAAEASLAAAAQGKFWDFHDRLFGAQRALGREALEAHAKELGLDMAKFRAALDGHTYAAAVDADLKLGEQVSVSGTPTMFINGKRVPNPTDADQVAEFVSDLLAAAK